MVVKERKMRHRCVFGAVLLATLVAATGCASRGWVREIEGNVKQHAVRLDSEGKRIDEFGTRIDAVGQRVDGLGRRVDDVDGRVGQLARHHHSSSTVETVEVHFGFNKAALDDAGMTRLHELAKSLKEDNRLGVELVGYTDPRGAQDYNVQLAHRRVEAVRRYLVDKGVQVSRIAAVGLGPLGDRNVPDKQKRRVTIAITVPEIYTTLTPAAAAAQSPSASIAAPGQGQSN